VLINDLKSPSTASNYMFLTPNTVDDIHDCNDVSVGNAWLNKVIPQILGSALFTTRKAALFVTFDEKDCTYSMPVMPDCYSALKTVEDNWKLAPLIASTDGSASNMSEFLRARL
jgi:hypothetical protein